MNNPIKTIVEFNKNAGLLGKGYSDELENAFQIEEALEDMSDLSNLHERLLINSNVPVNGKELSRKIILLANGGCEYIKKLPTPPNIPDVKRVDKACDAIVFAVGSMAKLDLSAQQITACINAVMKANNTKLKCKKDANGKLMKPEGFVGPEAEIQKILDQR